MSNHTPQPQKRLLFRTLKQIVFFWLPALVFFAWVSFPIVKGQIEDTAQNWQALKTYTTGLFKYWQAPPPRPHRPDDPAALSLFAQMQQAEQIEKAQEAEALRLYPLLVTASISKDFLGREPLYTEEEIAADVARVQQIIAAFQKQGRDFLAAGALKSVAGLENDAFHFAKSEEIGNFNKWILDKKGYSFMMKHLPKTLDIILDDPNEPPHKGHTSDYKEGYCYVSQSNIMTPCKAVFQDFLKSVYASGVAAGGYHPFNRYVLAKKEHDEKNKGLVLAQNIHKAAYHAKTTAAVRAYQVYLQGIDRAEKPIMPPLQGVGVNAPFILALSLLLVFGTLEILTMPKYGIFNPLKGVEFGGLGALVFLAMLAGGTFFWHIPDFSPALIAGEAFYLFGLPLGSMVVPLGWTNFKDWFGENPFYKRVWRSKDAELSRLGGVKSYIERDITDFVNRSRHAIQKDGQSPVYFGRTLWEEDFKFPTCPRYLGFNDDLHLLTIAGTGAGKSRTLLFQNTLMYNGGLMIFDPKGEHVRMSYDRRSTYTKAHIIDPANITNPAYNRAVWNPLEELDKNDPKLYEKLLRMAESMVISNGNDRSKDKHFIEVPRILFACFALHIMTTYPREKWSLCLVFDLMTKGRDRTQENTGNLTLAEAGKRVLEEMVRNPTHNKIASNAAFVLQELQGAERSGMMTTIIRSFEWVTYPNIAPILNGKSTFSMRDIKAKHETLYMVLPPEYKESGKRFLRLMYQMGLDLMDANETKRGAGDEKRVLMVFDEFYILGHFAPALEALNFKRSSAIKCWFIMQNLSQLTEHYGKPDQFLTGCNKLLFGIDGGDDDLFNYVGRTLGTTTIIDDKQQPQKVPVISDNRLRQIIGRGEKSGVGLNWMDSETGLFLPQVGYAIEYDRIQFTKLFPDMADRANADSEDGREILGMKELEERDAQEWAAGMAVYEAQKADREAARAKAELNAKEQAEAAIKAAQQAATTKAAAQEEEAARAKAAEEQKGVDLALKIAAALAGQTQPKQEAPPQSEALKIIIPSGYKKREY